MYKVFCHLPKNTTNLSSYELTSLFFTLQDQGLLKTLFYDGGVGKASDFVEMMQDDSNWFYLFVRANKSENADGTLVGKIRGYEPLGFCWLNGHSGRSAMLHFTVLRHAQMEARQLGLFALRMLLLAKDNCPATLSVCAGEQNLPLNRASSDTPYCLDCLLGLTPKPFRHALDFIATLGFKTLACVPNVTKVKGKRAERIYDGVLTCLTRADLLAAGRN